MDETLLFTYSVHYPVNDVHRTYQFYNYDAGREAYESSVRFAESYGRPQDVSEVTYETEKWSEIAAEDGTL